MITDSKSLQVSLLAHNLLHIIAVTFVILQFPLSSAGAMGWKPIITSYDHPIGHQVYSTWRIAPCDDWTYFATQNALLEYDGSGWNEYHLNNRSDVRGVTILPDRSALMVGGENEFGRLVPDISGSLTYTCLSDSLPHAIRSTMGNIFDFYQYDGIIYARGDFTVVAITPDNNMRSVTSDDKIFASAMRDGILYIATDNGIRMLSGDRFLPLNGVEPLTGIHINALLTYRDGLLVATANNGIHYYDGHATTPFITGFDSQLRGDIISCAAINDRHLAVGTVKSGLWVQDLITSEVIHLDVDDSACYSNMVQSVAFDHKGNLWIGHDLGIDYAYLNHPFTLLYNDFVRYGMGNTSLVTDGLIYFGTNRALYECPLDTIAQTSPVLTTVAPGDLIGSAWYLYKHTDGDLLLMHGKGIYLIKGRNASRITDIIGTWMCQPVEGHDDSLWVGAYQGIYLLRKRHGQWISEGRVNNINEPCRYFTQHGDTLLVYNRKLNTATPYLLDSTLLVATSLPTRQAQYNLNTDGILSESDLYEWNVTTRPTMVDSSHYIIPFNRGFMSYDRNKMDLIKPKVRITGVRTLDPDTTYYRHNISDMRPDIVADARHNVLNITFDTPSVTPFIPVDYQYRLNDGEWSQPSRQTSVILSHLAPGHYDFEVRTLRDGTPIGTTDRISFRILPPWYRTWWAYASYIIVILSLISVITIYERKRRSSRNALMEKGIEMDTMKEDILALKHQQMEQELQHKSREVANLTINMARKNEILISLKDEIHDISARLPRESASIRQSLLLLNNKIDANIEDDDILRRFEQQFDLAYNNYMTRLRQRHPDLTLKERLLCAYIKMDLSSKEIASLMNITVRGIESLRYRMRKKLGLDADTNLSSYLDSIDRPGPGHNIR